MFGAYDPGFAQAVERLRAEFQQGLNRAAGGLRKYSDDQLEKLASRVDELGRVTAAMAASRHGGGGELPSVRQIESIPGRRVPYVLVVDIPVGADVTSTRENSVPISQEGPFVCVRRMATFQSALEYSVTSGGQSVRFTGRSYGRYRPVHSVYDLMDGQHNSLSDASLWFLSWLANPGEAAGIELPAASLSLPSNSSSFRSMEFDGRISVINAGSSYPRQNISVPSSFWAAECNSPVALGALDFFERGEVITVRVQPNHVNNPPAGNVDADAIFPLRAAGVGAGGWPFVEGQYDLHEGIATADASTMGQLLPLRVTPVMTDPVSRMPEGILTVAWEGYRIIQPVGVPG